MCQDEWLNESVIPSANEHAITCVTKRSRGVCTIECEKYTVYIPVHIPPHFMWIMCG